MLKATLSVGLLLFLGTCTLKSEHSSANLDYEVISLDYQTPDCEPERDGCLMVTLQYPKFLEGDSSAIYLANRIIRNSALDFLGMGDVEASINTELALVVEELDSSFLQTKEKAGTAAGWMAELHTSELFRNDTILVLEANAMSYFGGAHSIYNTRHFNFDRRTGSLVPLSNFVDLIEFTTRAELAFRSKYLKEGQSFLDAGFNFLGGNYVLSANYAHLGDSILLHYNHYEIAPYTAGQFEVSVPLN